MRPSSRFYRYSRLLLGELLLPYDHLIFKSKRLTTRRAANFLLGCIEGRLRLRRPLSYPFALQLEPTIQCQLECPYCPRIKATEGMSIGHMAWDDYEQLMREVGPYLAAVAFWQWGEPLLHPRILDMVKLANGHGIITFMSTNAQVDPAEVDLQGLVDSGLDMLIISMDGATQEVYENFRAGGQLHRLKRFVEAISRCRAGSANRDLRLNVRIVVTRDNEKEVEAVRNFAAAAGADFFSVKSISLYYDGSPENPSLPQIREYRSYQYRGSNEMEEYRKLPNYCRKPWTWPTLRYDGTLLFCECDHQMTAPLGNVFSAGSFRGVWQGKIAQKLRARYRDDGLIELEFCSRCRYKLDDAIRRVETLR
jgi:MoaA/NifB/PqqE/SkfB family radical SAM enzyme